MSMNADYVSETPGEREFFELAEDQWTDYQERFVPLENQFIQELSTIPKRRDQMVGRAAAGTKQAFDDTYAGLRRADAAYGNNPTSGAATMGTVKAATGEAATGTKAMTVADQNVDDAYYSGQRTIMGLGSDVRGQGIGLSGVSAGMEANQENINRMTESYNRNAMFGAGGMVLGAGGRTALENGWFGLSDAEATT